MKSNFHQKRWFFYSALTLLVIAIILINFCFRNKASAPGSDQTTEKISNSNEAVSNSNGPVAVKGNFDLSGNTNTEPVVQDSSDPYYYIDQATVATDSNEFDKAILNVDKAIDLEKKNPNFYIKKAEILTKMAQKDRATLTIRQGLEILPGNSLLTNELEILNLK